MRSALGAVFVEIGLAATLLWAVVRMRPLPPMQFRRASLTGIGVLAVVDVLVLVAATDIQWAIGYLAIAMITLVAAVFILVQVGIPTRSLAVVGELVVILVLCWAIFYRVADLQTPPGFGGKLTDAVDALYFRSVIASTLGLGEVTPQTAVAKVLLMLQLFAMGTALLVVGAVIARRVGAINGGE